MLMVVAFYAVVGQGVSSDSNVVYADLDDGLVAFWSFDTCEINDDSGNNHGGTIFGTPQCVDGMHGKSTKFNEVNKDYILIENDIKLDIPEYTISGWFFIDKFIGDWEIVVSRMINSETSREDAYDIAISSIGELVFWYFDSSQKNSKFCCVNEDQWYFVVIRVKEGKGEMFLDDVKVSDFTIGFLNSNDNIPVCIGCNDYNLSQPGHFFNGILDNIRIYDRAISDSEIQELFTEGSATSTPVLNPTPTPQSFTPDTLITDSVKDFSDEQGKNNWFYGYMESPFQTLSDFKLMEENNEDGTWFVKENVFWTAITSQTLHPQGEVTSGGRTPLEQWAVRRWESDFNGDINISGVFEKFNTGGGDGTSGFIYVDGVNVWEKQIAFDGGVNYEINTSVKNGSKVDFVLTPGVNSDDRNDTTKFTALIISDTNIEEPLPTSTPTNEGGTTSTPEPTSTPVVINESQPEADFRANPTLGAAPLEVQFTDASKGGPTGWFWEFGDGGTAFEQNPTNVYRQPGLFKVKLEVSNSFGRDIVEKTEFISVKESSGLQADFEVDRALGFVPLKVKFTDLSNGGPTGWLWRFGDGGTNTDQDPEHTYLIDGIFSVELAVTRGSAVATEIKSNFITATENRPVANFKASATAGQAPFNTSFTDLSQPVGNISSWTWEFGDGKTSSEQGPSHTYDIEGFYSVALTVSNDTGADIERKTNLVVVLGQNAPVADFSVSTTTGLAPLDVKFTDLSEPADTIASWVWDFGDGAISSDNNPNHIYNNEGIYTARLTVSNSFGADSETKPNIVSVIRSSEDVIAGFSTKETIGVAPATIEFINNSAGDVVDSVWEFGDDTEFRNPGKDNVSHTYREPGDYDVRLTVTGSDADDNENRNDFIKIIEEGGVAAGFRATPVIGSSPLEVQFVDMSIGKVASWDWDFDDSGSKSTEQNPVHTFFLEGEYNIKLTVNSTEGKGDTLTQDEFITVLGGADDDPDNTPKPGETPTPDDTKSFTFKCRQHSLIVGEQGVFEKMNLELGENEQCTVTLTNLEPGTPIEFSTYLRSGRSTSIQVSPENGVTDANGQMAFTISAIEEGSDWIAWAVRNDKGEFEFSKSAYNNGTAWGMFVEVK